MSRVHNWATSCCGIHAAAGAAPSKQALEHTFPSQSGHRSCSQRSCKCWHALRRMQAARESVRAANAQPSAKREASARRLTAHKALPERNSRRHAPSLWPSVQPAGRRVGFELRHASFHLILKNCARHAGGAASDGSTARQTCCRAPGCAPASTASSSSVRASSQLRCWRSQNARHWCM